MSLKIKIMAWLAAAMLLAGAVWYVRGLRADNVRMISELALSNAALASQAINISKLALASGVVSRRQAASSERRNAFNQELNTLRRANVTEEDMDQRLAAVLAGQLNRLFSSSSE